MNFAIFKVPTDIDSYELERMIIRERYSKVKSIQYLVIAYEMYVTVIYEHDI